MTECVGSGTGEISLSLLIALNRNEWLRALAVSVISESRLGYELCKKNIM